MNGTCSCPLQTVRGILSCCCKWFKWAGCVARAFGHTIPCSLNWCVHVGDSLRRSEETKKSRFASLNAVIIIIIRPVVHSFREWPTIYLQFPYVYQGNSLNYSRRVKCDSVCWFYDAFKPQLSWRFKVFTCCHDCPHIGWVLQYIYY